jgi:TRAP-type C4-dicarboxylate transport system permease large subunit
VGVLALCGVVGVVADAAAVVLLFWAPWAPIFTKGGWDLAVGAITIVSIGIGLVIYFVSERARTQVRGATPQVESGLA